MSCVIKKIRIYNGTKLPACSRVLHVGSIRGEAFAWASVPTEAHQRIAFMHEIQPYEVSIVEDNQSEPEGWVFVGSYIDELKAFHVFTRPVGGKLWQ